MNSATTLLYPKNLVATRSSAKRHVLIVDENSPTNAKVDTCDMPAQLEEFRRQQRRPAIPLREVLEAAATAPPGVTPLAELENTPSSIPSVASMTTSWGRQTAWHRQNNAVWNTRSRLEDLTSVVVEESTLWVCLCPLLK